MKYLSYLLILLIPLQLGQINGLLAMGQASQIPLPAQDGSFLHKDSVFKIAQEGTVTITVDAAADAVGTATITHGLGYNPVVLGTVTLPAALNSEIMAFPGQYYIYEATVGGFYKAGAVFEYFATDTQTLTLQVRADNNGGDYVIKYFILSQEAN